MPNTSIFQDAVDAILILFLQMWLRYNNAGSHMFQEVLMCGSLKVFEVGEYRRLLRLRDTVHGGWYWEVDS